MIQNKYKIYIYIDFLVYNLLLTANKFETD